MLRNLLAERFALRVRVEEQETPHYALVLANPGDVLERRDTSVHDRL